MTSPESTVETFIFALARKDADGVRASLAPAVRFRGLTPNQEWQADASDEVVSILFGAWFETTDLVEELVAHEVRRVADRFALRYSFAIRNADGRWLVEQQGYASADDAGRIADLSIVCSGYRAVAPP